MNTIKYPHFHAEDDAKIDAAAKSWHAKAPGGTRLYVANIAKECGLPTDRRSVQYLGTLLDGMGCTRWRDARGRGFLVNK